MAFGLYVHWPFCKAKCPYCDFNSHVAEQVDHGRWLKAYERELEWFAAQIEPRSLNSIFFGGGTPSLMHADTVAGVIEAARRHFPFTNDIEITLEANPTSAEQEKFEAFRMAGVNRLSLGVQSFDPKYLKFLGREHSAAEAEKAIEMAQAVFERVSFDLIYARPEQSVEEWEAELQKALAFKTGHLSLYQLTIEQGTPFYIRHARGEFKMPDDVLSADFYDVTEDMMADAGCPSYEVSNYAAHGLESRHNMTYWRYDDYIGIGPGAHGRLVLNKGEKAGTRIHRAPDKWLELVESKGHGSHEFEVLSPMMRFEEALMMGLRLKEGIAIKKLEQELGQSYTSAIKEERMAALVREGLMHKPSDRLQVTAAGIKTLNAVLAYLLAA